MGPVLGSNGNDAEPDPQKHSFSTLQSPSTLLSMPPPPPDLSKSTLLSPGQASFCQAPTTAGPSSLPDHQWLPRCSHFWPPLGFARPSPLTRGSLHRDSSRSTHSESPVYGGPTHWGSEASLLCSGSAMALFITAVPGFQLSLQNSLPSSRCGPSL